MAKIMAGVIRDIPGGAGISGATVTARDDLTGIALVAGGMGNCATNPVTTASDGYFTYSCELSPGPVRFEAVAASQTKVRSGREIMQAVDYYLSDVPSLFRTTIDGIILGIKNEYSAVVGGGVREVTLNTGDAILKGFTHGIDTTRTLTHAANGTMAERWDLIVLQQWVGGTSKGKQSIAIVVGTVNQTEPTINTDANIFEFPIWRAVIPNGATAVTLVNKRVFSFPNISDGSIAGAKLANNAVGVAKMSAGGSLSSASIASLLKAPTSGNTPAFASMGINELVDVALVSLTDNQIMQATSGIWLNVNHDHSAQFVDVAGDTMTGALVVNMDALAFLVRNTALTKYLAYDPNLGLFDLNGSSDFRSFSGAGAGLVFEVDGATGDVKWGAAGDVVLKRHAADILRTDDSFLINRTSSDALTVEQAGGTDVFNVNTAISRVDFPNSADITVWSDNYITPRLTVDGATGDVETKGAFTVTTDNGLALRVRQVGGNDVFLVDTLGPSVLVSVIGDTFPVFRVRNAALTDIFRVRTDAGNQQVQIPNGSDLTLYSDDGTTEKVKVFGATGVVRLGGALLRTFGNGDPEGVVTAPVGSTYQRTDGGAGTSLYIKESGAGNTGWVGK